MDSKLSFCVFSTRPVVKVSVELSFFYTLYSIQHYFISACNQSLLYSAGSKTSHGPLGNSLRKNTLKHFTLLQVNVHGAHRGDA